MITGISVNGQTSNTITNSPLTATSPSSPISTVAPSNFNGGGLIPLFDALALNDSWLGNLSQLGSQIEEYLFGGGADLVNNLSLRSLFSSDLLANDLFSGAAVSSNQDGSSGDLYNVPFYGGGADTKFLSLFPYSDLASLSSKELSSAGERSSSVLDYFGLLHRPDRNDLGDFSRIPLDRSAYPQSTPVPINQNSSLFFRQQHAEQARLRYSSDPARMIPWEERKKRDAESKRNSLLSRAWGRIESGVFRFVRGINDALSR